jgi:hypothetical protein
MPKVNAKYKSGLPETVSDLRKEGHKKARKTALQKELGFNPKDNSAGRKEQSEDFLAERDLD